MVDKTMIPLQSERKQIVSSFPLNESIIERKSEGNLSGQSDLVRSESARAYQKVFKIVVPEFNRSETRENPDGVKVETNLIVNKKKGGRPAKK